MCVLVLLYLALTVLLVTVTCKLSSNVHGLFSASYILEFRNSTITALNCTYNTVGPRFYAPRFYAPRFYAPRFYADPTFTRPFGPEIFTPYPFSMFKHLILNHAKIMQSVTNFNGHNFTSF